MFYASTDNKGIHLDKKLNDIFQNKRNGFFIELGGYDGITQSNTCFFEKELNWSGILIEPSINQYNKCKINRPNSIVLNYACVSDDYDKSTILIDNEEYLMTSIDGKRRNVNKENLVAVQTSTLNKILASSVRSYPILKSNINKSLLSISHAFVVPRYKSNKGSMNALSIFSILLLNRIDNPELNRFLSRFISNLNRCLYLYFSIPDVSELVVKYEIGAYCGIESES